MSKGRGLILKGRNALRAAHERARRQRVIAARRTDLLRWHDTASYKPAWATRLDAAMPLMADALWVADLGCGMQDLRERLPPGATYLPMDIKRWTDDTLVCDLNARHLPDRYIALCDLCVVMGVLEYLYEPDWLLARVAEHAEALVLSYNAVDGPRIDRAGNGWVNAFTTDEIVAMIERTPYRVTQLGSHGGQLLAKATRWDFDAACQERREERRRAFQAERAIALAAAGTTAAPPAAEPIAAAEPAPVGEVALNPAAVPQT